MAAWDRQPKEPPKAFARFVIYRDLGPDRSLEKVGRLSGVSAALCERESAERNWVARCGAWDAHLDAIARKAYEKEAEKQARLRAQAHAALLGKSLELLRDVESARLGEIASSVKIATDGMRTEAGLATERREVEVEVKLSDEERRARLAELLGRGEDRAGLPAPDAGGTGGS